VSKSLEDMTAAERDARWRHAHQKMIADRKRMLVEGDGMDPREAERKAARMQDAATNRARAMTEGRG
jgi:hypothetical protein